MGGSIGSSGRLFLRIRIQRKGFMVEPPRTSTRPPGLEEISRKKPGDSGWAPCAFLRSARLRAVWYPSVYRTPREVNGLVDREDCAANSPGRMRPLHPYRPPNSSL